MATLLDALNQSMQTGSQQATPALGETEQISQLMRAKSGKAGGSTSAPRQSSLTEAVNAGANQVQSRAMAQQGGINLQQQASQQADIDQRSKEQNSQFNQQRKLNSQQLDLKTNQLLDEYTREGRKLDTQQDIQNLEQIGSALRLNNQQYVDKLKLEGQKARLDNDQDFKTKLNQQIFSDMEALVKDDNAFKTLMNASDRDFQKQLAEMDINSAWQIANSQMATTQAQSMWSGIGTMAQTGLAAYDKYSKKEEK